MPVYVSLLRGVNVGGNRKVKMDALRELYESLGLGAVETFIQSGNVVFSSAARDAGKLAGRISAAIEKRFGFPCEVVCAAPRKCAMRWNAIPSRTCRILIPASCW